MGDPGAPLLRRAEPSDAELIEGLMRSSILDLFPAYYDERQTASAAAHVAHVDMTLIQDDTYYVCTYYVCDSDGVLVACGGWSRRGKLYTGSTSRQGDDRLLDPRTEAAHIRAMFVHSNSTRLGLGRAIFEASRAAALVEGFRAFDMGATVPGVPFYLSLSFTRWNRSSSRCPTAINAVRMEMPIERPGPRARPER